MKYLSDKGYSIAIQPVRIVKGKKQVYASAIGPKGIFSVYGTTPNTAVKQLRAEVAENE